MSDDLRDKFESDDDYDQFKNQYNDYKNQSGAFDTSKYMSEIIAFQAMLYDEFIVKKSKYFKVPERFIKSKNLPMYVFHFETTLPDTDTVTFILN